MTKIFFFSNHLRKEFVMKKSNCQRMKQNYFCDKKNKINSAFATYINQKI